MPGLDILVVVPLVLAEWHQAVEVVVEARSSSVWTHLARAEEVRTDNCRNRLTKLPELPEHAHRTTPRAPIALKPDPRFH